MESNVKVTFEKQKEIHVNEVTKQMYTCMITGYAVYVLRRITLEDDKFAWMSTSENGCNCHAGRAYNSVYDALQYAKKSDYPVYTFETFEEMATFILEQKK